MNRRSFGQTGLQVHPICLGGNVFGWSADEATSFKVLDAYVHAGGNFIDTADVYSRWVPGHHGGESETILGRWLKRMGQHEELVIATKVGMEVAEGKGLSHKHIHQAVERSLQRLQLDTIDLYYAHQDDAQTPLEETLEAFDDLIQKGKVRAVAASNYTAQRLGRALEIAREKGYRGYTGLQVSYNLLERQVYEGDLESLCSSEGLGVVGYYSLAAGFLSGKYREGEPLPSSPRAQGVKNKYMNAHGFRVLHTLEKVAEQLGATVGQVALAWGLSRPSMTGPIVSGTTPEQVQEFMRATELRLSPEALYLIENASGNT
jgi:aryl-alcohol dehydrogenase-like predicted oxidoreductase